MKQRTENLFWWRTGSDNADVRIVRQIKNSLGPSGGEIWFEINARSGFHWLEPGKQIELLDPASAIEEPQFQSKIELAAYLIKKILEDGDVQSKEVFSRLSEQGIGKKTIEEAKKILGIKSYRQMRQWYWSLECYRRLVISANSRHKLSPRRR